jgi:glycerol kinase
MRIAALDQGTTSTRVLVREPDGSARVVLALRHAQHHPQPGWVEHDPLELLANLRTCLAAAGPVDIIGLANQGESCLAWDEATGAPLSPVIVWQDNRTAPEVETLTPYAVDVAERAGLPLDAYFSASKLAWILRHLPKPWPRTLRLSTTDAFFLHHLTGQGVTDITTASRTSLMNLATGQWDDELCTLFGIPREALPEIRPTSGDFGDVAGVPLRASVVDQQAALFGHGCRQPGDAKITFGTGAFTLAVTGAKIIRAPEQGLLPTVAWSRGGAVTYAMDGGVYDAGSALEWASRISLFSDFSELQDFSAPPAISRKLAFVPALSGLACPHWDRSGAALFVGMSAATSRQDLLQALLEGIALRTAEVVAAMSARIPLAPRLSIDGGLTRSAYFVRFLANALGREIVVPEFDELTAFGVAALASPTDISAPGGARVVSPDTHNVSGWHAAFAEAVARAKGWRQD